MIASPTVLSRPATMLWLALPFFPDEDSDKSKTQGKRCASIGDAMMPSAERAVVDVAPARIHIGHVFNAGFGSFGGVVLEDWEARATFVHGRCAVGA